MWRVEPAPTQTRRCRSSVALEQDARRLRSGNGATAPGSNPVAAKTSSGRATRAPRAPDGGGDLRLVGPPVARDEREHGPRRRRRRRATSRSRPARSRSPPRPRAAVGVPSANSSSRASTRRGAQDGRDALDRLGPGLHVARPQSSMTSRVVEALARSRSTSSGGGGESTESTISALPPRRLRETVMFAMFTPASPKSVPTRPITPGHVVVAEEHEQRRELDLEVEAERAHEPLAVVAADRRARDADLLVAGADLDGSEVRVVARRLRPLLAHLDAALARDQRRVHVVHRPVGAALEGAVQRGRRVSRRVS